jgi:hypothetical protein
MARMCGCSAKRAMTSRLRSLRWKFVGVEHHGNIDSVGDSAEIGFDLRVLERKIGLEDRQDSAGAERLVIARLRHRVRCRGRGDAGDHRHAALCGLDGGAHHGAALLAVEIGELAGRAERREAVHPGLDQVVAQFCQHVGLDAAGRIDRRDEIRKDAVEVGHHVSPQIRPRRETPAPPAWSCGRAPCCGEESGRICG